MSEVKINRNANSITFTNNNISFSQFGIAKEILDLIENQQQEIERLNKRILTLEETIRKANNNIIKDIAMIKTHEMIKQEIVQRLVETSKILESGSDKE